MSIIQIKRGLQEAVDRLQLAQGELAVALDTGNVYIGGQSGTIHVNPKGGTADVAEKLKNPRAFSISGDATSNPVNFDGTADVQLQIALANIASLSPGTYTKVTVDQKGRVTAGNTLEISDIPSGIPTSKISGLGTAASVNTGTAQGNVPVVQADGKLLATLIPDLSGTYVPSTTTINGKPLSESISLTASDVSAIPASEKGAPSGVAELDESGKVPAAQLPSYVDDVEEYENRAAFPLTGESGKIYVSADTNLAYRWTGTTYIEISQSLALGETSSTAYPGDKGKIAYDHSQITNGNPHGTTYEQVGAAPSSHVSSVASASAIGHVKAGVGLSVESDGTLFISTIDGGTFS